MDLLNRYLAAIRRSLPAAKADDIAAELRDDLMTRIEDREEALGRPLRDDETSALLKDFGHPLVIAARYKAQQYLIGPEVFPFYLFTLKIVLAVGAALVVAMAGVGAVFGDHDLVRAVTRAADDLWSLFFAAVAIVTIVFAVLERYGFPADHLRKWTPEQLPDVLDKPQSQWEAALEVGLGIAFLLWWTGAVTFPAPTEHAGVRVVAGPVWEQFYLPILALASAQLAVNLMKWLRPRWKAATGVLTIAVSLATLAMIGSLYGAGAWVEVTSTGMDPAEAAKIGESVNLALRIALIVVGVMMVLQTLGELWKLARPRVERVL